MRVFVFGNPDLAGDSLPLRLLPELQKKLPDITFNILEPNEEWDVPENVIALDTVQGINGVHVFNSLEAFSSAPRVTMHDFDALANLRLMQKLGKIKKVTVVGVPPDGNEQVLLNDIAREIRRIVPA